MDPQIDISSKDAQIVQTILRSLLPVATRVWVFGSRAKGASKRTSDLDLAIDANRALTRQERYALIYAFEESDLAYRVDLVDMHQISSSFKAIIEKDRIAITEFNS